jgi:hypothetical protein
MRTVLLPHPEPVVDQAGADFLVAVLDDAAGFDGDLVQAGLGEGPVEVAVAVGGDVPRTRTGLGVEEDLGRTEVVADVEGDLAEALGLVDGDGQFVVDEDALVDLFGGPAREEEAVDLGVGEDPDLRAGAAEEAVGGVVRNSGLGPGVDDEEDLAGFVFGVVLLVVDVELEFAVLVGDADDVDVALVEDGDAGGGRGDLFGGRG